MNIKTKDILFVGIQFILFLLFTVDFDYHFGIPFWIKNYCLVLVFFGLVVLILALLQLNKNLSPFPSPKENSILLEQGLYKWVRHPIYSGVLLLLVGSSFYQDSIYKLAITFLLLLLFFFKAEYEEEQLELKFGDYKNYKERTGKFLPKISKSSK